MPTMLAGIKSLTPTENGLVVVQDGYTLQTYDRFGAPRETQLSGMQAAGELKMTRSHLAVKPGQMAGHAWRNIWPVD